jgi:MFS family permease
VLAVLAAASAVGSMGLAAGGTAGALLGAQLAGTDAAAGLPLGLLVLGSAGWAVVISRYSARSGRMAGLALGHALGAAGAALCVAAAATRSLAVLLVGSVLLGSANAAIFLARYAASELGGEEAGGRALGFTLLATSVGAVGSPLLLAPSGALARSVELPALSGIYVLAALAFAAAASLLAAAAPAAPGRVAERGADPGWRRLLAAAIAPRTRRAVALLAGANFVMVGVMAVAPLHLMGHGHDLRAVGTVISLHVAGMFVPSPLSGWLADRAGPGPVAGLACVLVLVAGVGGTFVHRADHAAMALVLVVLGVGWNFGVVAGSTLIARSAVPALRPYVEAVGEVAMGMAAAVAAPLAGAVIALGGFSAVSVAVVLVALAMAWPAGARQPPSSVASRPRARSM